MYFRNNKSHRNYCNCSLQTRSLGSWISVYSSQVYSIFDFPPGPLILFSLGRDVASRRVWLCENRRDVLCEFDYWPLAVSMPPTKVCPQCKAAVPVRWKTCECYAVFRSKAECNLREKALKRMRAVESDSVKSARKAKDRLHKPFPFTERQELVSELYTGRNKTEYGWQV